MVKNGFKQYFMASEGNPFIFYIFTFYCLGFYDCVLELDPNPGCHTPNLYRCICFSDQGRGGILHIKVIPTTLTLSGKNGKCCIHALSPTGQFCSHPMGAGGRTEPQSTGGHQSDWSLLFGHLFPGESSKLWLKVPTLYGPGTCLALSEQMKMPIIISKIKQMPFSLFPNMGWIFFK